MRYKANWCNYPFVLVLLVIFCVGFVSSSITPPRLFIGKLADGPNPKAEKSETVKPSLMILEGHTMEVEINSEAVITVSLNQVIPGQSVSIDVSVKPTPGLLVFYDPKMHIASENITLSFTEREFGDRQVMIRTAGKPGHAEIFCSVEQPQGVKIDNSTAFISVSIYKSSDLNILITIFGWIYFFAWSITFYFQVILNYQRKSVVGLNFDFLALNLLGFTCYSIFNYAYLFSYEVQQDYYQRYNYQRIPVEFNDLFFAVHATLLTLITVIQCFLYERGNQKVSMPGILFVCGGCLVGICTYITYIFNGLALIDVMLCLSYIKLIVTLVKYSPQAYMNYERKSTIGWSIHSILLDSTGGAFSLAQMFLLASNYNDWISIFGNPTKFGLGIISILFDILFLVQHYILYRDVGHLDIATDSIPDPVINSSITSSHRQQISPGDDHTNGQSEHNSMQVGESIR